MEVGVVAEGESSAAGWASNLGLGIDNSGPLYLGIRALISSYKSWLQITKVN